MGVAAGLLLAVGAAACTTARSDLGTSDSSCYQALPTVTKAVHSSGRLLGVHKYSLGSLHRQAPRVFGDLPQTGKASQRVCVAAFGGHYSATSVSHPHGLAAGRLAVVVVTTPGNRVLGTIILTRPPLRFGHSHLG